jgi:hypothetical protein
MKTTNAKSKAFLTPAPLTASAKTQKISPRLRRPKVKVHQPEVQTEEEDDVPEVEYMPPKEIPLPDNLDEDMPLIDWSFPQFKGANMTRGTYEIYHNPVEDDGRTRGERELEESLARDKKKANEEFDRLFADMMAKEDAEEKRYLGIESPSEPAPEPQLPKRKIPAPSTLKARSAAAALQQTAPRPRYAAPTGAVKSRVPTGVIAGKKPLQSTLRAPAARNAAAVAASKSTIGYAQGRATGPATRKPLSNVARPPSTSTIPRRPTTSSSTSSNSTNARATTLPRSCAPFSRSSSTSTDATLVQPTPQSYRTAEDVEREMAALFLQDDEEENANEEAWMNSFKSQLEGETDPIDEQFEDFQLQLPDGI